jgi:hypothetical protein
MNGPSVLLRSEASVADTAPRGAVAEALEGPGTRGKRILETERSDRAAIMSESNAPHRSPIARHAGARDSRQNAGGFARSSVTGHSGEAEAIHAAAFIVIIQTQRRGCN